MALAVRRALRPQILTPVFFRPINIKLVARKAAMQASGFASRRSSRGADLAFVPMLIGKGGTSSSIGCSIRTSANADGRELQRR
jgi:hypothetical protein